MEQDQWTKSVAASSGAAIKRRRDALGLSADALARRCSDLGFRLTRQVIANLETGQRSTPLSLAELLVLARALDVPPVMLIVPLDQAPTVAVTPVLELPAAQALAWLTGEASTEDAEGPQVALDALRRHNRLVRTAVLSSGFAEERRREAQIADPDDYEHADIAAKKLEEVAHRDRAEVLTARRRLREIGMFPPPLPSAIAFIDPSAENS